MARGGRKKAPFYRIVVADSRMPRDGRYIEQLGYYNPLLENSADSFKINAERLEYWHGVGAKPSEALAKLLVRQEVGPQAIHKEIKAKIAQKKAIVDAKVAAEKAKAEAEAKAEAAAKAAEEAEAAKAAEAAAAEEAPAAEASDASEEAKAE